MVYRVSVIIEELIDEDDEIQGNIWPRRLYTFSSLEKAQEYIETINNFADSLATH